MSSARLVAALCALALSPGCRRDAPPRPAPDVVVTMRPTADVSRSSDDAIRARDVVAGPASPRAVHPTIEALRTRLLAAVPEAERAAIVAVDVRDTDRGDERQLAYLLWDLTLRRLLPASVYGGGWRVGPVIDRDSLAAAREVVYDESWRALLNENTFGYAGCTNDACAQEALRKAGCNSPALERTLESLDAFLAAERPQSSDAGDAAGAGPSVEAESVGRGRVMDAGRGATPALLGDWQVAAVADLFRPQRDYCRRATALAAETVWELAFAARHRRRAHAADRRAR